MTLYIVKRDTRKGGCIITRNADTTEAFRQLQQAKRERRECHVTTEDQPDVEVAAVWRTDRADYLQQDTPRRWWLCYWDKVFESFDECEAES